MDDHGPLVPADEHSLRLEANVRPRGWTNPVPSGRYHLVVIGAGTAGLVTAAGAAGLGARVALIERGLMGGDCLNSGCVPSKAVIRAARAAAMVGAADQFGVTAAEISIDFAAAMQRMRRLRAEISHHDSAHRFRNLGVDVYFGHARFVDSDTVDVEGRQLKFRRAVVATGARAAAPPIPGLDQVRYLTNETLFSLTEPPQRLGVIGAGPIGCEMAQALARLGCSVVLIESEHGILPRDDRAAAEIVGRALVRDGVRLHCCARELRVEADGAIRLRLLSHGQQLQESVDQLLVAAGRTPNVEELGLEAVGVSCDRRGITVNQRLQTTNPRIYAAGDVCSPLQFTHAADFQARIVIQNALFLGRRSWRSLVIPWCTFTSPELAQVGLTEVQARERGLRTDTFLQELRGVDRAVLDGEDEGFVKVAVRRGTDQIVGATVVAAHAGELISEITLAMTHGLGLRQIGSTIHPYPTQADAIRQLGDQYNRTRLTPLVQRLLRYWLHWTG